MSQLSLANYINNFGGALLALLSTPTPVPVHYAYNPKAAQETEFVVWAIRNVSQEVWTGAQENKGIDRPIFGITLFTKTAARQAALVDKINSWHGYNGNLNGISVGKAAVDVVVTTYDEESSLYQAVIDIAMQVAVPTFPTAAFAAQTSTSLFRRI